MRGIDVVQFIALLAITPAVGWSAELSTSVGVGLRYESNLNRNQSTGNPVSDYGVTLSPAIGLREDGEDYDYALDYQFTFVRFKEQRAIDDVNHNMSGRFSYVMTPRLIVYGSDSFRLTNDLISEFNPDDPDTPIDESGVIDRRTRNLRNVASLGLQYLVSNQLTASLSTLHDYFDPEASNQFGSNTVNVSGNMTYRFDRANTFGAGASTTFQFFEALLGVPASRSDIFQIFGIYRRKFTEDTQLSLQGGPTWIRSTQESPPSEIVAAIFPGVADGGLSEVPNAILPGSPCSEGTLVTVQKPPPAEVRVYDPSQCGAVILPSALFPEPNTQVLTFGRFEDPPPPLTNQGLTFFLTATLSHRWTDNLRSNVGYRRSEGNSQGQAGTTIRDRVSISTSWRASPRWRFSFRVAWSQRASETIRNQTLVVQERVCISAPGASGTDCPTDTLPVIKFTGDLVTREVKQNLDQQNWSANLNATRQFTRRLSADARYQWVRSGNLSLGASNGNHRLDISLSYRFDPIRLLN